MTLIVARYNWIADEISVGQREASVVKLNFYRLA